MPGITEIYCVKRPMVCVVTIIRFV